MKKSEWRKSAINMLKEVPESKRESIEEKLKHRLTQTDEWKLADVIGITISNGFEWNTRPIIEEAWKEGKTVCVPKCHPKQRSMDFHELHTYDQLEVVYYSLLEPDPKKTQKVKKDFIDVLVVPGLLFDKKGYRIGFGGGYYDRFLTDFPNKTISLASNVQLVDELPAETFDIPVKKIITENGSTG
ncbi:5-formyltetrahydrofolate cyclo-ligase [Virgibacillus kekensis]|uniref:5-formyltetrahydrofolate cyclo-ligase n=1 Tax=Virgibacillus kekensis TaxID=202261 RepID=A0ABV9DKW4_9BACI